MGQAVLHAHGDQHGGACHAGQDGQQGDGGGGGEEGGSQEL